MSRDQTAGQTAGPERRDAFITRCSFPGLSGSAQSDHTCGPVEYQRGLGAWPLALRHRWGPSRLPSGLREAPCPPQGSRVVPPGRADLRVLAAGLTLSLHL